VVINDETDIGGRVTIGRQGWLEDELFGVGAQRVAELEEDDFFGALIGEWLPADLVAFDALAS
jgi:hypothetical protein